MDWDVEKRLGVMTDEHLNRARVNEKDIDMSLKNDLNYIVPHCTEEYCKLFK